MLLLVFQCCIKLHYLCICALQVQLCLFQLVFQVCLVKLEVSLVNFQFIYEFLLVLYFLFEIQIVLAGDALV